MAIIKKAKDKKEKYLSFSNLSSAKELTSNRMYIYNYRANCFFFHLLSE